MEDVDLKPLLAGVDDRRLIWALNDKIRRARNDAQGTFVVAMETVELLNGDGFEMLLEQQNPLEDYAQALIEIGLPQVRPIFDQVAKLIPKEL